LEDVSWGVVNRNVILFYLGLDIDVGGIDLFQMIVKDKSMATKNQQTEMQQVISFLKPHICSSGLKNLKQYSKLSIKEAWDKCTSSEDLLDFKLISAYGKDSKFKNELKKAVKLVFEEILTKIKIEIKNLPKWASAEDLEILPIIKDAESEIFDALGSVYFDYCFGISESGYLNDLDAHTIIKKHIKPPTLQDFLNIKMPDAEQKKALNDWKKLTDERQFELFVQYKLYNSSGKRLFK
jgi:hypothetical protein